MEFMSDLVHEWVTQRSAPNCSRPSAPGGRQNVTNETFPFTEDGLALAAKHAAYRHGGGYTTPRDIQKTLDDLLNRAIDDNRRILRRPMSAPS